MDFLFACSDIFAAQATVKEFFFINLAGGEFENPESCRGLKAVPLCSQQGTSYSFFSDKIAYSSSRNRSAHPSYCENQH